VFKDGEMLSPILIHHAEDIVEVSGLLANQRII
jgi:hypothetical protein